MSKKEIIEKVVKSIEFGSISHEESMDQWLHENKAIRMELKQPQNSPLYLGHFKHTVADNTRLPILQLPSIISYLIYLCGITFEG